MADKKVTVVAKFTAKPGLEDTVRQEVLNLVGPTREEAGCINYDLHQSLDDPAKLILYENWVSKDDLDKHLTMPYLEAFKAKADELLAEPLDITLWEMISTPAESK